MRRALLFCANTCLDKLSWHVNKRALSLIMSIFRWHTAASPHLLPLHLLSFQQLSRPLCCCIHLFCRFLRHEQFLSYLFIYFGKTNHLCDWVLKGHVWSSGGKMEAGRRRWRQIWMCVGLRISADLRYQKKHPTVSFVFRCRPHVAEHLPKKIKRQRWLLLFFLGLGRSGRLRPTRERVEKWEEKGGKDGWWNCGSA